MNKNDFIWLYRNTTINNHIEDFETDINKDIALKISRKHHLKRIQQIFSNYKLELYCDYDDLLYCKIKGFSIDEFLDVAKENNSYTIYFPEEKQIALLPPNRKKYLKIFRRSSPSLLANLSNRKKLDILFSLHSEYSPNSLSKKQHFEFLENNTYKINALLQLKVPEQFIDSEKRKVRLIAMEISKLPKIGEKINNFENLSQKEKEKIITNVIKITSKYNNIETPNIYFFSKEEINNDDNIENPKWIETEAYTYTNNIVFNKDFVNKSNGLINIATAFHETNHIAQSYGDYSNFEDIEDMFNSRLIFTELFSETYIFTTQELLTYPLEYYFMEEIIKNTKIPSKNSFSYMSEYNISGQYLQKALSRKY